MKAALAYYARWRTPGQLRSRTMGDRVQGGPSPTDNIAAVDVGALLRSAGIEAGSRQERAVLAWALGLGPYPSPEMQRVYRAVNRARAEGRDDLIARPPRLASVRRTRLPGDLRGLREEPLDPRSPLNDPDYEVERIERKEDT